MAKLYRAVNACPDEKAQGGFCSFREGDSWRRTCYFCGKTWDEQGSVEEVKPENGKYFTLAEWQRFCGGIVQIVPLPSGKEMVCNDEGKLIGLPPNRLATALWKEEYPIHKYPNNNDELVVGDVLIYEPGELQKEEDIKAVEDDEEPDDSDE